ncbi:unnamed protein product [Blepharisma stoltei]|uniref:Uncharacterized protein n=1 Tax=Blepharisma stoltei TaxID=1481888 RepID=A0AAU9J8Q4_9CILI|nr:unnamed protein product [Blepharisma stoltei]
MNLSLFDVCSKDQIYKWWEQISDDILLCNDRISLIQCLTSAEQELREILEIPPFTPENYSKFVQVKEIEFILKTKLPESEDNIEVLTESIEKCRKEIKKIRDYANEMSSCSSTFQEIPLSMKFSLGNLASDIMSNPERFEDPLLKKIFQPSTNKNSIPITDKEQTPIKPSQFFADIFRS